MHLKQQNCRSMMSLHGVQDSGTGFGLIRTLNVTCACLCQYKLTFLTSNFLMSLSHRRHIYESKTTQHNQPYIAPRSAYPHTNFVSSCICIQSCVLQNPQIYVFFNLESCKLISLQNILWMLLHLYINSRVVEVLR